MSETFKMIKLVRNLRGGVRFDVQKGLSVIVRMLQRRWTGRWDQEWISGTPHRGMVKLQGVMAAQDAVLIQGEYNCLRRNNGEKLA